MMGSSYALTTMQMVARGLAYEPGSVQDTFCRIAMETERRVEYVKTLAIVNAIIGVGNHVVAALTESPADSKSSENVKKALAALRGLILPEDEERTADSVQRARLLLEREAKKGPVKFRTVGTDKPKKGRVKVKV